MRLFVRDAEVIVLEVAEVDAKIAKRTNSNNKKGHHRLSPMKLAELKSLLYLTRVLLNLLQLPWRILPCLWRCQKPTVLPVDQLTR